MCSSLQNLEITRALRIPEYLIYLGNMTHDLAYPIVIHVLYYIRGMKSLTLQEQLEMSGTQYQKKGSVDETQVGNEHTFVFLGKIERLS